MGRPPGYQWQPLGVDADPVPGDPQAIAAEAAHLKQVASTITGQIAAMRKIASENTETGQHAEKIRSAALDLAGSLQKVATRYAAVSSALSGWVPELEQAQALSIRALNEAEAPHATLTQAVILPSGPDLTAAQDQEIAGYHASLQRAQDQLVAAKTLLTRAVNLRDTKGAHYAAKINQASDDSLADHESLWGDITHAIASCAWIIKDACTVLEVAAAVLAVIALFATGAGWLIAAFALTALALAGRTVLAATGNGSWLDVAADTIALATLGVSGGVTGAAGLVGRAGSTLSDAVGAGDQIVNDARAASLTGKLLNGFTQATDAFDSAAEWMGKYPILSPLASVAEKGADVFEGLADFADDFQDYARPLATAMVNGVEQESALARAAAGGEDLGNYMARMSVLRDAFSSSPKVMDLAGKFDTQVNVARSVILSSAAVNVLDGVALPGVPVFGPHGWQWHAWDVDFFSKLEDRMSTAAIPLDRITDDVWHVVDFQWA
jgi:hypothetical protein